MICDAESSLLQRADARAPANERAGAARSGGKSCTGVALDSRPSSRAAPELAGAAPVELAAASASPVASISLSRRRARVRELSPRRRHPVFTATISFCNLISSCAPNARTLRRQPSASVAVCADRTPRRPLRNVSLLAVSAVERLRLTHADSTLAASIGLCTPLWADNRGDPIDDHRSSDKQSRLASQS